MSYLDRTQPKADVAGRVNILAGEYTRRATDGAASTPFGKAMSFLPLYVMGGLTLVVECLSVYDRLLDAPSKLILCLEGLLGGLSLLGIAAFVTPGPGRRHAGLCIIGAVEIARFLAIYLGIGAEQGHGQSDGNVWGVANMTMLTAIGIALLLKERRRSAPSEKSESGGVLGASLPAIR